MDSLHPPGGGESLRALGGDKLGRGPPSVWGPWCDPPDHHPPPHPTGEACWWTMHPASKQRSEGEKVRVGDDLILVSVSSERYLVRGGGARAGGHGALHAHERALVHRGLVRVAHEGCRCARVSPSVQGAVRVCTTEPCSAPPGSPSSRQPLHACPGGGSVRSGGGGGVSHRHRHPSCPPVTRVCVSPP